jgi:hypothetical protein
MRQHIHGIDHAVIVVRDLDAARKAFHRMGFVVTPRGQHTIGSSNHCVMFANDYIELLMSPAEHPHPSRQYYTDFAARGEGVAAIALKTESARSAYTELLWSGFEPTDPVDFSRPVALRDGTRDAKFRVVQLGNDKIPGGRVFVCEHFTRDVVWRPEYCAHRNGATGLAAIALWCDDVVATARAYERLFDTPAKPIAEGLLVETGDTPIAFIDGHALERRLPQLRMSTRARPLIATLFVHVADRDKTEAVLKAGGVAPARMPDGSVAVGANVAHGVALIFG